MVCISEQMGFDPFFKNRKRIYGGSAHQSHGAGQRKALSHKVVRRADGINKREAEAEYGRG